MAPSEQEKLAENNNKLYVTIGISASIIIIFLFFPWVRAFNGSLSTLQLWRSLSNIEAFFSTLSYTPFEGIIFLKIALIIAFVTPVLLGIYIINSLITKKINQKLGIFTTVVGIIIFFICFRFTFIIHDLGNGSIIPSLVIMKSSNAADILRNLTEIRPSIPVGAAQILTPFLLIANFIVITRNPYATVIKSHSRGEISRRSATTNPKLMNNIVVKYFLKALPLVGITIIVFLFMDPIDNGVSFFIGHAICLILAYMTSIYIGWPVGLFVTVIYGLFYIRKGFEFYLLFDSVFIIVAPILLKKYQNFKIRISIFTGIGVLYGIIMFALRETSYGSFYDGGKSLIPVILYYVILCNFVYLFFEFGWLRIKPHLPQKVQKYFVPVVNVKYNEKDETNYKI